MPGCWQIELHKRVTTAVAPTPNVCRVAAMFGLGVDQRREIDIVPPTALRLTGGQVLFITGASGGGKTTMLRLIAEQAQHDDAVELIDFGAIACNGEQALVDSFGDSIENAVRWLSLAGLNDAFVMLRKPAELSDGQRYRLRLAHAMAAADRCTGDRLTVVLADEFGATLDRLAAAVISRNVGKWVRRNESLCFIAATTHDDLLEPLEPDVLIVQHPGEGIEVIEADT